jgi:hypothetical protein
MDGVLLLAIIAESVNAPSVARRRAASILARVLRSKHPDIGDSARNLLLRSEVDDVGRELIALMAQYGIEDKPG